MKILMLGWELPPHHTGGLGMVCYQLCKQLARNGADIDFILPYTADYSSIDFMKINPVSQMKADEVFLAGGIYDSQRFLKLDKDGNVIEFGLHDQQSIFADNVAKYVRYAEFDVIHSHDWLTMRAAMAAKMITGKPLFVHIHATEYDRSGGHYGNPHVRDIEYYGMMMADKVIAISDYVKNVLVHEYRIPEDKIVVVHNSIDKDLFSIPDHPENEYHILEQYKSRGYKVISAITRITLQKNLVNTMRAFAKVVEKHPKTIFLLVGSGDQELELINLAAELKISANVIFVPFQTGKKWRDAFRVSDLFILTSASEPFGITPLEAIGFGTPVLISKQSGVSEVLTNALKVDFWDVDEMANQMLSVVENDSLRDELYHNSKQEWDEMGWQGSAEKMMTSYHRHLQEANA